MEIKISPEDPVVEDDEVDVELHCNLLDSNPEDLHSVFWYKDGQLFRYEPFFGNWDKSLSRVTPDPEVCEDGWTGATLNSDWVNLDIENDTLEVAFT